MNISFKEYTFAGKSKKALWRPSSLINLSKKENSCSALELSNNTKETIQKAREWNTIVTIVLIDAKNLPALTEDGYHHSVYCKFRLGLETFKSKTVPNTKNPQWRERFELRMSSIYDLNISLWDKGKEKNAMGSCVLDLSKLEKERTHEIFQDLESGFGLIHISITMCSVRAGAAPKLDVNENINKCHVYKFSGGWDVVGVLNVTVIAAKGLTTKPNAFCVLEMDNERVQTHKAGVSSEPRWNRNYTFNVFDVSSSLELRVYDSSIMTKFNENLGKVSIPLLRVKDGEMRWYALKDRSGKHIARGNCPRVLLQMSLVWDPLKATLRLFRPRKMKHIKKEAKFDVALVYSNTKFIANTLTFTAETHENLKKLFEWDNKEVSFVALTLWIIFCHYLTLWAVPLLLMMPFLFHWICYRHQGKNLNKINIIEETEKNKETRNVSGKIQDLQTMTLTITNGIEFMVVHAEKIHNLVTFKVPYFSYVAMVLLVISSLSLYLIPFNYMLMGFGIYKYTRKYLNPSRILNDDLLDFLSRVPDNHALEEWKELSVPEPNIDQHTTRNLSKSMSNLSLR